MLMLKGTYVLLLFFQNNCKYAIIPHENSKFVNDDEFLCYYFYYLKKKNLVIFYFLSYSFSKPADNLVMFHWNKKKKNKQTNNIKRWVFFILRIKIKNGSCLAGHEEKKTPMRDPSIAIREELLYGIVRETLLWTLEQKHASLER